MTVTCRRVLTLAALALVATAPAIAGPLGAGMAAMGDEVSNVARTAAGPLGALCTVIGGGRAAWSAAHSETFTTPLLAAIVGVAILAGL